MPSPPTLEKLEGLRPQTAKLLDDIAGRCPQGGRLLHKKAIGGYSARRIVHWAETGEYPSEPIKPTCRDEFCVDCGRPGLAPPPDPEPESTQPIPPPPPVPDAPSVSVELVRAVDGVEPEALEGTSRGDRSSGVPRDRFHVPAVPAWLVRVVLSVAFGVVFVLGVVVAVQAAGFGLSNVGRIAPNVEAPVPSSSTLPG